MILLMRRMSLWGFSVVIRETIWEDSDWKESEDRLEYLKSRGDFERQDDYDTRTDSERE